MGDQRQREPHDLGLHRVVDPEGTLPQAARVLDARSEMYANEIAIDVETLNIDSASFAQIVGEVGRDPEAIGAHIMGIVEERGKMQNPVTGSGGMLLGEVAGLGSDYSGPQGLEVGSRVATLVSLTLTPLALEAIEAVHVEADQVDVQGRAYLWPSSPVVAMPGDMDERVALAALDVCGAPAQTRRLVEGIDQMVILGAGKSGMLCAAAAREVRGDEVDIFALDWDRGSLEALEAMGLVDGIAKVDATRPVEVLEAVRSLSGREGVGLCINTCNIGGTEMGAILGTQKGGVVYFFNMATDFSRAALGCEGVGRDVTLIIGNGYVEGHAKWTLSLLRAWPAVAKRLASMVQ